MSDANTDEIAFAKIFPPIGIARVGDSESEYFFGPEFASGASLPQGENYRDAQGRIKRQATRFRIYGFNAKGTLIGELTTENAEIVWTAHLANKKAAWFRFDGAEKARRQFRAEAGVESELAWRNPSVGKIVRDPSTGRFISSKERMILEIDGGIRTISGVSVPQIATHDTFHFAGTFRGGANGEGGHRVYLGELRTDDRGRLIVLGGRGVSLPVGEDGPLNGEDRLNYWITNYANNDSWCDDTADGPVTASVTLKGGKAIPVEGGAWVVVAPPDFAPDVTNIVTLYDVMEEVAVAAPLAVGAGSPRPRGPEKVNFGNDVRPVLVRVNDYRWVSPLGLRGHGRGKPGDAADATAGKLQKAGDSSRAERDRFFSMLRVPTYPALDPLAPGTAAAIDEELAVSQATSFFMPPLSGDEGDREPGSPEHWLTLTRLQYARMNIWRQGSDEPSEDAVPTDSELEPARLTRTALTACAGGAFFPGIEITSIAREPTFYSEAFRIDHGRLAPGDVTKYMACPWQADFYECRDTWWPAQRPDTVITDLTFDELYESFQAERPDIENLMFRRERWDRGLERKPRPSRDYLIRRLLPEPVTADGTAYTQAVTRMAARSLIASILGNYADFADKPVDAENAQRLPSPWRLQYLVQERLDAYSGRYFLPCAPAPDTVLEPDRAPCEFVPPEPPPSMDAIRHDWHALRINRPAYAGYLLGTYAQATLDAVEQYTKTVIQDAPTPRDTPYPKQPTTDAQRIQHNVEHAASEPSMEPVDFNTQSDAFKELRAGEFVNQLVSRLFLANSIRAPDMAMVDEWRHLGFVRKRVLPVAGDGGPIEVQVETERPKYSGASFRDYFYYLLNISEFPDFVPYCKTIADEVLTSAQKVIDRTTIFDPNHPESFAPYSPSTFAGKLEQIYEVLRAQAAKPPAYNYNNTRGERIRALTGNAPFNQVDGAWLRYAANAGTMDEITSLLFNVWSDEVGNGDPSLHHGNLYTTLLKGLGVYLPDVTSRGYVDDPRFDESTFIAPVFELAISQHTQEYFPEILGMTLFLEWEVLSLVPGAKRLDYFGIDPQFFRMHIGIDNASEGHGAMARRAVEIYLDQVLRESGVRAQQAHWQRIWRGFVAFAVAGYDLFANVGPTLSDGMSVESETALHPETPAARIAALMERKKPYGNLNHVRVQLGAYRLNDLFDDTDIFLDELEHSSLVTPGDPETSRFLSLLTTFQGPMYKVFSAEDLRLWREWIEWLGREGDTSRPKTHVTRAEAMRILLTDLRPMMVAAAGHHLFTVPAIMGADAMPIRLSELFASPDVSRIMRALRDPRNGWVVPYRPSVSPLIVELMRPGKPMGAALDRRFPKLFDQVGRMIVFEWIAAGCPLPGEPTPEPSKAVPTRRRQPRLFVQQYGMGAVH